MPAISSPPRRPARSVWAFALAAVGLLAVALGGSTARWSEGIILALTGLVLLVAPPRRSLGPGINGVLVALLALGATAFLPARWFHSSAWRSALTDDLGVTLPATLSPQPWLSAESLVLLAGGIGWFYLMATVAWTERERPRAGRWYAGGVVALAAVFIACSRLGLNPSIWHTERGFGPFPNRNQTADFLAVGALPVLACAHLAWRGGRRAEALAWLAGWAVVAAGIFQNYSRAGIGILFAGTAVYGGNEILRALRRTVTKDGDGRPAARKLRTWRAPALAASLVLLLASGFLVFGGETLARLRSGPVSGTMNEAPGDYRLLIQRDTFGLLADSPWCGNGLGTFNGVFAPYRVRTVANLRVIHPESDWLWLAAELGWPAAGLALVGAILVARRIWPQRPGTDRPLRAAAAWGAVFFALHGFVDVSAHRVGTAWCGLFLIGLALPAVGEGRDFRRPARWAAPVFRALGLVLLTTGLLWVAADRGQVRVPGAQEAERRFALSRAEAFSGLWAEAAASATGALALDPLDWRFYYQRAVARLADGQDRTGALADFRRTFYLEPFSGNVAETAALAWARVGEPDLALSALLEAARRVPSTAREYFNAVCAVAGNDPSFLDRLAAATRTDPARQLLYVEQLPLAAHGVAAARILADDPTLRRFDAHQREQLFCLWADNPSGLMAAMERYPAWQPVAWRCWARACASAGQPERACQVATRFAPKPALPPDPPPADQRSVGELRAAVALAPGDAGAALRLSRALSAAGDKAGALLALEAVTARRGCPPYLYYLQAVAAGEAAQWTVGWEAWGRYLETVPGNG